MRKSTFFFVLLAALLVPLGAKAQNTLTVADGTATNGYVPIYGYYADAYLHAQMIYPAEMLDDMTGGAISELVWYLSSPATGAWGINVVVSMAEVDDASFSSNVFNTAELTEVWSGNVDGTDPTLDLEFDVPFIYEGGNLLIDVYTTTEGTYKTCSWAGIDQTGGSVSGYDYSTTNITSPGTRNFLPKATFTYSPGGDICYKPHNLTLDEATTESLAFHWTQRNDAGTPFEISIDGTVVEPSWTDTFYTATGLNHSTSYTVQVRSLCSAESTSGYAALTTRTLCANVDEFPYTFTFEDGSLDCWSTYPGTSNVWIYDDANFANNGDRFLIFYSPGSNPVMSTAVTPPIVVPENAEGLQAQWAAAGNGSYLTTYPISYEVYVSTTAATTFDTADFELVLVDTFTVSSVYKVTELDLSDYAGQSITLAFRHTTPAAASSAFLMIDDLSIRNESWPLAKVGRYSYRYGSPDAYVMVTEEATFESWLLAGSDNGLQYTWSSAMANAGLATMTTNFDNATLVYSEAGTDTLTLAATNSSGYDTVRVTVHVEEFDLGTLPFYCGFDDDAAFEPWTIFALDSTSTSTWRRFTPAYSGSYGVGSWCLPDSAQTDVMLVSPAIAVPENVGNMSLMYHVAGFVYDSLIPATYEVLVSTNGRSTYSYFTDVILQDTVGLNDYEYRNLTLNGYAGDTIYLAFHHTSVGANGLLIDELEIREAAEPVVDVDYIANVDIDDTATFTATMLEGIIEGVTYTWTSTMLAAGDADLVTTDADSIYSLHYTVVGYDTVTLVVTNAFGSDSLTMIVHVRDLSPAALPYSTGFEPTDDNAYWQLENAANAWYIDTVANNGGSYGLYISADTGATNSYSIGNAGVSYAYRVVNIAQAGEYAVSYDWRADGESNYDFIRVFLAPIDFELPTTYSDITYGSLPAGCIAFDGGNKLNLSSDWQNHFETASITTPGNYMLAFCWRNDGSVGTQPPAAIDNVEMRALTCPRPTAIAIDSIGTDYIAFSWLPAGEETEWMVSVGDSISEVVTDTVFTAIGLAANTAYTIQVRALCGEGDTSFAAIESVRTECGNITLPYFEDFENGGEQCWRILNYYTSNNNGLATSYSVSGNSHRFYPGYNYQPVFAVLPRMENISDLMVSFYLAGSSYITVMVGTMTSPTDTTTFVPLYSVMSGVSYTTTQYEAYLDGASDSAQYIAFRFGVNSSWGYYAYIDNVTVQQAPSCRPAQAITIDNISIDGATINITDSNALNHYLVVVTHGTDTVFNDSISSDTQVLTGLQSGAVYTVSVRSICDEGSVTSAITANFNTDCGTITSLPWSEDFDVEGSDICWTVIDNDNRASDNWYRNTDGHMRTSYNDVANANDWLISPAITLPATGDSIGLSYIARGSTYTDDDVTYPTSMTVMVSTTGATMADFTDTLFSDELPDSWTSYAFSLAPYMGQTVRIAFIHDSYNDNYSAVDDVFVGNVDAPIDTTTPGPGPQPVVCNTPTITASPATDSTITLVWSGTAASYEVAIVEGQWAEPASATNATGPSYTFTGLNASTQYTVGVRAVCDGDSTSAWAFRTVSTQAHDTTGIRTAELASFGLYPNPATSTVTVDLGSESAALVAIIDQSGRKSGEWRVENGKLVVNVSDMAKGAYFVRVTTATGTSVRKLIVK